MSEQFPKSDHFHLKKIAGGVYAALARPEGLAGCNCGIIDLGSRVAVVDTSLSPDAAGDLRDAAKQLTGRPVDLVLLTHHHFDHIWGNQAFPQDICIFSSEETRRAIQEKGPESLQQNRGNAHKMVQSLQEKMRTADQMAQTGLADQIDSVQKRLALINSIELRPPNLTSQGPVSFFGDRRHLEFIPYPKAHSPGNAVIFLPQDGIVFVGDLLFSRMHPFIGDGDPQVWIDVLAEIEALQPETIVPGHGAISTLDEIRQLSSYLQTISDRVQAFVSAGKPAEQLNEIELPEPYDSWEPKDLLMRSLQALYGWYSEKSPD